ncbi:FKBP-type peptidyl-prolyl cis-trans isomerase [Psychrobium sp. 1_MG-2023]|uniref:FKBP-type peptidyl-prolyl cis-trans isomerase n=1 Tax=Psychrobium sp. 1_MG-2023 TaxID=3062624 RepID=UPI000C3370B4|nr:FKBP-type peptidyl-prolyl cis-trans isomerase [Psychrobium sp. 1_MG-2023]MDP2560811.1 FKBP-type peptidyl-prolyl cis-trans isomerase [Psychrobium sp. 1_MG-2023]PKF56687.1 peptidylprolyl isomerase [Alteromonadales bacterium alter-6D02]
MNKMLKISTVAAALFAVTACNAEKVEKPAEPKVVEFKNEDQKAAYAIGVSVATYINKSIEQQKEIGVETDKELIVKGFTDAIANNAQLTEEQTREALMAFDKKINEVRAAKAEEDAAKAKDAGIAYLAENAKKEGVTVTESGLQYKVIQAGEGAKPTAADSVTVHYKGTLTDGTKFDSSYDRGQPATFPLGGVIAGWTEGVQLMSPGAKFEFTIPSELAYGERGTNGIPAHSTLVFEVELIEVAAADAVEAKADAHAGHAH